MWKRIINLWKALINALLDKCEDPNMLLEQAKRDGADMLQKNREHAVQAITMKNNLQSQLDSAISKSAQLEAQAGLALKQGHADTAAVIMREKISNDNVISTLTQSVQDATVACDNVKKAIVNQETQFKKQCADALVMKAQYSSAQAQNAIAKSFAGMEFHDSNEGFSRAQELIQTKVSEASARKEMGDTSITAKIMEVANAQVDVEAEAALGDLAARLGIKAPSSTAVTGSLSSDAVDAHALEQRLTLSK